MGHINYQLRQQPAMLSSETPDEVKGSKALTSLAGHLCLFKDCKARPKDSQLDVDRYRDLVESHQHTVSRALSGPLIKLMMEALKSSGCAIDLNRHICCEPCSKIVTGGYDAEMNQIVICQNTATTRAAVHGALAHEMVHMFDFCRANVDFKNIDHLLCTEIRAANLMHCSFLSSLTMGATSLMRIKRQHQECVKKKALASVMAVRELSENEANEVMDRVFTKCYNDLEPLGRRLRRNSKDVYRVYRDRYLFGYGIA